MNMTMNDRYILDAEGNPIPEPDLLKWAQWYEKSHNRHVAEDWVGNLRVSTIFLGLDHSFFAGAKPVLWETMIFERCPDCDEARRHAYSDATTPGFFYPRCEKHREREGQGEGEFDHYQQRYTSREDALAGHQEALALVRQAAEEVKREGSMKARIRQGLLGRWYLYHATDDYLAWSGSRWVGATQHGIPTEGVQVSNFETEQEALDYAREQGFDFG